MAAAYAHKVVSIEAKEMVANITVAKMLTHHAVKVPSRPFHSRFLPDVALFQLTNAIKLGATKALLKPYNGNDVKAFLSGEIASIAPKSRKYPNVADWGVEGG